MREKIQRFVKRATSDKHIRSGVLLSVIVIVMGLIVVNASPKVSTGLASTIISSNSEVEIGIAGATSSIDISRLENSWPGELISLGSIPVQPAREGTILSWNVHVGQKVSVGEVLGTLSVPPAMPDTVAMLANEQKMVSMARVNAEAKRIYTKERILQLEELRANTTRSLSTSQTLLGGSMSIVQMQGTANFSMIEAKKQTLRAMLRGTLATTYPMLSGNTTLPVRWNAVVLKDAIGAQNSRLRDTFPTVLFAAINDIDTTDKLPIESGLAYFDLTIKLADASIPDGNMLTESELTALKAMLHREQESFIMAVDKLRETQLMSVETEKMAFEQVRMIDNDIAMLKQDLAMSEGDLASKEAAYWTVRNDVLGNSSIFTPRTGTVSLITKNVGEFVGPGMPVAVVTSEKSNEYIVRFRIPSNIRMPDIGQELHITRPGFPGEMPRAKLIGAGNSLDETGSVMADALLLEPVDWPVGASLRVLVPEIMNSLQINLTSLWWDSGGKPNVWGVSAAGRVYTKQLTLGRTIGSKVEVYDGLIAGDRYITKIFPGIIEDMLIDDMRYPSAKDSSKTIPEIKNGHEGMPGMDI